MLDPTQLPVPATPAPPAPISTPASSGDAPPPPKPNIQNTFVRRAVLYNEMADSQARRLAAATSQPPANSTDLASKPGELARAWHFSPSQNPAQDFWELHDQTLAKNMAQIPPGSPPEAFHGAHADAEAQALNAVYPYRSALVGVGIKVPDDQVAQAARIKRMTEAPSATSADVLPVSPATAPVLPVVPPPPPPMAAPPPMAMPSPVMAPPPALTPAAQPGQPPLLTPQGGPV